MPNIKSILILSAVMLFIVGCTGKTTQSFDVQSGPAETTFRIFAEQAGVGVLFDSKDIYPIVTNRVIGQMTINKALELMIKETNLSYVHDKEAGLITIKILNENPS